VAGAKAGAAAGDAVGDWLSSVFSTSNGSASGNGSSTGSGSSNQPQQAAERNAAQDKALSNGEINKLKKNGIDPHDLKPNSQYDLFKDKDGNIYVKPKDGSGPGDPTGYNIYDY